MLFDRNFFLYFMNKKCLLPTCVRKETVNDESYTDFFQRRYNIHLLHIKDEIARTRAFVHSDAY